ncbi:MAG TPA: hypothetical protein VHJ19_05335 [Gammaproteobacteria bacterium]|nr:hypothetical protein [Gammaproteobacteria bacterium]
MRLGYFGSYARGDWGVGNGLDVVAIVAAADAPFERRGLQWDLSNLPVPRSYSFSPFEEWKALQR